MKAAELLRAMNDIQDSYIEDAAPKGYLPEMKRSFSWLNLRALAGVLAVLIVAVLAGNKLFYTPPVQVVNPMQKYSSMEEAQAVTGFSLTAPETYKESTSSEIIVYNGTLLEIQYYTADDERSLYIRKAAGSEDISGDYTDYPQKDILEIGGKEVTLQGENDLYNLAVWTENDYSYCFGTTEAIPLSEAERLIGQIE